MTTIDLTTTGSPSWIASWPEAERAIHRSVRGRLPAGVEPEDVSQQVAVDLIRAGDGAPPADRLNFWSVAVARRVVADLYRRKTIPLQDLAAASVVDVEATALTRMRCEAAAKAYADLTPADRQALAEAGGPRAALSNSTKLRRTRARRALRQKAERLVGGGLLLPRWAWLAGAAGTAAAVVPLCLGLPGSGVDLSRPSQPTAPVPAAIFPASAPEAATPSEPAPAPTAAARNPRPLAPLPVEPGPTYERRVVVHVPGADPVGYDHYRPAPTAKTPPAACARNLKLAESVCVAHPLR